MTVAPTLQEPAASAPNPMKLALEIALETALNGRVRVTGLRRLTAGATKQTWLADVSAHGDVRQYILQILPASRFDPEADEAAPALQRTLTPKQDSRVMQLAAQQGVPVPQLVLKLDGSQGLGHGQITRFVAGETLAPRILRDARYAPARARLTLQCAEALASIHRIAPSQAEFLPVKDARSQWRDMRAQVDASGVQHPALEWGLRWIEERLSEHSHSVPTVVHGDFRLGNLIVNDDGIAAVIDWELAHLGDPMQDLAWLCLRTWRFGGSGDVGGFGERRALYAAYEHASDQLVSEERLFFWEMACQVRWAVMCLGMGLGTGTGSAADSGSQIVSLEHRLIGRRLAEPLWDMIQLAKSRGGVL